MRKKSTTTDISGKSVGKIIALILKQAGIERRKKVARSKSLNWKGKLNPEINRKLEGKDKKGNLNEIPSSKRIYYLIN